MELENFKNINNNSNLKEKLEKILNLIGKENNNQIYTKCQGFLEYILAKTAKKCNFSFSSFLITDFIKLFDDNFLKDQLIHINALYNEILEQSISEFDISYLLLKIDYIVGHIEKEYGII